MNSALNGSSCSFLSSPSAEEIAGKTFAYCLIFFVSLVGNSFIGIVVYKTPTLRKPINYFIVNMAISDLLFSICFFPVDLTDAYVDNQWLISGTLGQVLCTLIPSLVNISIFVSIQSLVLIAVDRFGAVALPLRSPLISSKLCPFFILATWIASIAVNLPYSFALKLAEHSNGKLYCDEQWDEASSYANYNLAIIVGFFHVPIALLVTLYSVIVIKVKTQIFPGEQSVNTGQQRSERNRNVLKLAIAIVVGLILCWVPYSIIFLLLLFARDLPCGFWLCYAVAYSLTVSYCAINPCICFAFSGNYRQGLKRLLKCFNTAQEQVN